MTAFRQKGRFPSANDPVIAEGWAVLRLTPASRLHGANGLRTGRDGRIYVAQVVGSQVSAIDVDSGEIETISPMGGGVVGPDDLAFDENGNIYLTEITQGQVVMLEPNGTTKVVQGNMPVANPITYHQGRLIAGECRYGARIMELDRSGGAPRIILENVPMANAFEVGPDGKLYFPVMGANEIWRVDLNGGNPEVVAGNLGVPDSVKFDAKGQIVSTQVASGQVLRIDPRTGARTVLADLTPGLDNCTFVGERLFVSHGAGAVVEILEPGKTRALVDNGLLWPMGLAVGPEGEIYIADGPASYSLRPDASLEMAGMLFTPGYPGFTRGVAAMGKGEWLVTTASGDVKRYCPSAQESEVIAGGFSELMDVTLAPDGAVVFAEAGTGRILMAKGGNVEVLASDLARPVGVALHRDGACFVSEAEGGRVVRLAGGRIETVIDGLMRPEGITIVGDKLYVLDVLAKTLTECGLSGEERRSLAANLPVGAPVGVRPKYLGACGDMVGPMVNFAGIAAGPDGTIYISADGEGSVMALRPL